MRIVTIVLAVLVLGMAGSSFYYWNADQKAGKEISQLNQNMDKLSTKVEDFETRKAEQVEQIRLTHDSLVQSLRKEIEQGQIKIKQVESKLSVTLIDKILFASGKAEITPEGQDILTRVGKMLKNTSGKIIRVEGHTDNVRIHPRLKKKYASNWELSSARATVVVKHLQDKAKIPGKRLQAIGMSQYDPVESNATRKGRSMNRRVEITVLPDL